MKELLLGADTCWARAIIRLKQKYPEKIRFFAHIPNWDHCRVWKHKQSRDLWQYLINNADNVVCVDPIGEINPAISLNIRNGTMVDMSEVVFAISNGDIKGGTANCLKLAKNKNRKIKIWNPLNLD